MTALHDAFVAVGCNNGSHCMSRAVGCEDGYEVAFAASTMVAIARYSATAAVPTIVHTLHGHKARVACVYWHDASACIVSGDASGEVRLWHRAANAWTSEVVVAGAASSVSALTCTTLLASSQLFVFAALSNGDIVVVEPATSASATLSRSERHIAEAIAVAQDGRGTLLLALGGVDALVHVYTVDPTLQALSLVSSHAGHKGWVRDLAFSSPLASGDIFLASAAQDHKIRLWRIDAALNVAFDAMLVGHDDWVTSVSWTPTHSLLSSSMDNRLILWAAEDGAAWHPTTRIGDLGGLGLLAATSFGADLVALTFTGELYRWTKSDAHYVPARSVTGHNRPVTDVAWAPSGAFFVSVSLDQTARAYRLCETSEVSRAQVHGYDLQCATFLSDAQFVSGADEKILRVFDVPSGMHALVGGAATGGGFGVLPELSLTNKRGDMDDTAIVGEQLARRSLWPEVQKLYGHGNELLCVRRNHAGDLLASTCKARDESAAAIWLWRRDKASTSLVAAQQLPDHSSSVVQLAFSSDDKYLASVSKDRSLCIFAESNGIYTLVHKQAKAHKRIIWSCDWLPHEAVLATGSRDETIALWGLVAGVWQQVAAPMILPAAVTAVAFAPTSATPVLAVGLESGLIVLCDIKRTEPAGRFQMTRRIEVVAAHAAKVTRLAWHPNEMTLLSCSEDASVKLFSLQ
ncbi:hypothetical protein SPRG_00547 [Saprolegnia parasitica CBS 223.65]|uniref:Elongator complex protein 2 n=1 Tax=Saprolegnia parasitica (strain CBS 223.65) TaxID=695850 RepID=A0A067CVC9_SAPPC|nr:hypothetical protein SPRG_00547 [Saprolegnia parasitica CBS 223.65]KDO34483.1 hypothetical protein SPRG_00547 [Saprolegnia parasitica CBS 223.65]|eukprot:XP_012194164.1 hypothetical protein SPRG_00547 [Saprolegnia parasitica CBS 223.65]